MKFGIIELRCTLTATIGKEDGVPVFKFKSWRLKGKLLDDVAEKYKSVKATLNVMPFCSQFIPMEIIDAPLHKSIVYHPSILPRHRGANAIAWTLIEGDARAGLSIFWADDVFILILNSAILLKAILQSIRARQFF